MFEKKSRVVTLETLTELCEKETLNFRSNKIPKILKKENKVSQVEINDTKIKKIDIKQPGEEILWL